MNPCLKLIADHMNNIHFPRTGDPDIDRISEHIEHHESTRTPEHPQAAPSPGQQYTPPFHSALDELFEDAHLIPEDFMSCDA